METRRRGEAVWLLDWIGGYAAQPPRPLTDADRRQLRLVNPRDGFAHLVGALNFLADEGALIDEEVRRGLTSRMPGNYDEQSWFHVACGLGRVDVVRALVDLCGCDPTHVDVDENDSTPLHAAVKGGSFDIVVMLLRLGADPTSENWDCDSPGDLIEETSVQHVDERIMPKLTLVREPGDDGADSHRCVVSYVGTRSFGDVYKAYNARDQRFETVNVVRFVNATGEPLAANDRVFRLKKAIDQVDTILDLGVHPSIATIRGIDVMTDVFPRHDDRSEDNVYIFFDYVGDGDTLHDLCSRKDHNDGLRVSPDTAMLMLDVARGLVHIEAVSNGTYIHTNLKPKNVMVDTRTNTARIRGFEKNDFTPAYASPQTVRGTFDPAQHQWSWGTTMLAMICGEATWKRGPEIEYCDQAVLTLDEEETKERESDLHDICLSLCRRCLCFDPESRCSMQTVVDELSAAVGDDRQVESTRRDALEEFELHVNLARLRRMNQVVTHSVEDHNTADNHLKRALDLARDVPDDRCSRSFVTSRSTLAFLLFAKARYHDAEVLFKDLLSRSDLDGPDRALTLFNLARVLKAQGKYSEAEEFCQRAIAADDRAFGPNFEFRPTKLNFLATLLRDQGKNDAAERLFKYTLAVIEGSSLGLDHPDLAPTLSKFAQLLRDKGDKDSCDAAKSIYRLAFAVGMLAHGPDHPKFDTLCSNLT